MARNKIRGDAQPVAQVSEFTITGAGTAGDTITVPVGNKSVVVTVPTAPTVASVAAACSAALAAAEWQEFTEIEWTDDGVDTVVATANPAGKPFEIGTIAVSGTVTVGAVSTPTASSGPNHWDDPTNWSLGAVPVNGDDVDLIDCDVDLSYGLDQTGVTLASLNIHSTYTGKLGLPDQNGDYFEYRDTELKIGVTALNVGMGDGAGSPLIKVNGLAVASTVKVFGTSTSGVQGQPAFWWKGTNAANAMVVTRGSVGIAFNFGEVATLASLRVGSRGSETDSQIYIGAGLTLTTLAVVSGAVQSEVSATTVTVDGGTLTQGGTSVSITTLTIRGGTVNWDATGTVTTTVLGTGSALDLSRDPRTGKTFTNLTVNAGATLLDPNKVGTFTNGIVINSELAGVTLTLGDLITISRS